VKRVTVYVGRGCHLCEDALGVVRGVGADVPFALELVDITGDQELERAHRERLPVVAVDGVEAFHHVVEPDDLRALLAS
jgi:glutaredoxin